MKNIRTISRGTDGVSLQFTSKKSSGYIEFINGKFKLTAPVELEGQVEDISTVLADFESRISQLEADYTTLEARVAALEAA